MLEYNTCLKDTSGKRRRIDIPEGIYVNKISASKECDICHYWYFKDVGFKYKPYICNGCHYLMQKVINFVDVAIVFVKESYYRIHFWYMTNYHAISIINISNRNDKKDVL